MCGFCVAFKLYLHHGMIARRTVANSTFTIVDSLLACSCLKVFFVFLLDDYNHCFYCSPYTVSY